MAEGFTDFAGRVARKWRGCPILIKIIIVNVGVWLALRGAAIAGMLTGSDAGAEALRLVEMPAQAGALLHRPWTLLTYMWAQFDLLHLLFNMLWLYWFGTILMEVADSRRVLPLYLYGGIAGGLVYLAAMNVGWPAAGTSLIGSSASVLCIVVYTAVLAPYYRVSLLLIGPVSIKWIAIVTVGIDLLNGAGGNVGGHIAHLGGAATGLLAAALLRRKGVDVLEPANRLLDRAANTLRRSGGAPKQRRQTATHGAAGRPDMATVDSILDKIKRSGYTSLSAREREILFKAGNNKN